MRRADTFRSEEGLKLQTIECVPSRSDRTAITLEPEGLQAVFGHQFVDAPKRARNVSHSEETGQGARDLTRTEPRSAVRNGLVKLAYQRANARNSPARANDKSPHVQTKAQSQLKTEPPKKFAGQVQTFPGLSVCAEREY